MSASLIWFIRIAIAYGDGTKALCTERFSTRTFLRVIAFSSLVFFVIFWAPAAESMLRSSWPWSGGINTLDCLEWIGSIAFASFGVHSAFKAGYSWRTALFSAISLFSFGGGFIRDWLILGNTPWFIYNMRTVLIIAAYSIVFIIVYKRLSGNENFKRRWGLLLDIILTITDAVGILAFSAIGVNHGVRSGVSLFLIALCGLSTQLGGGLIAAMARKELAETLRRNKPYYSFACIITIIFMVITMTGVTETETALLVLLIPSIAGGLWANTDIRNKITAELKKSAVMAGVSAQSVITRQSGQISHYCNFHRLREIFYQSKLQTIWSMISKFRYNRPVFYRRLG